MGDRRPIASPAPEHGKLKTMRLRTILLSATLLAAAPMVANAQAAPAAAVQQAMPERITGTVKSLAPGHVVLATDKGEVHLPVTAETRILANQAAAASEIAPGAYLGTANQTTAEGGQAREVHLMADGPNVHAAMDQSGLMMTNGRVKSVRATAKGQEMEVDYGGGTRQVLVPAGTPVTRMAASDLASLKVGTAVTAVMRPGPDGKPALAALILAPPK